MDISDIDMSIPKIWQAWRRFARGKRKTPEYHDFVFNLESNLRKIHEDLCRRTYIHGSYDVFETYENKKRTILVAKWRDRVMHRLVYDYLVEIYDESFIYDLWSCRKGKGLTGAIERSQLLLRRNQHAFVWRSDVKKFFDSVDQDVLLTVLRKKIVRPNVLWIIEKIIHSYSCDLGERERERERE